MKGNQAALQADLERCLKCLKRTGPSGGAATAGLSKQRVRAVGEEAGWPPLRYAATSEVGHGRIEVRHLDVRSVPADLAWLDWPGCRPVFALHREIRCKKSGRHRQESVYGITSLSEQEADAASLLAMVRAHWQIENGVHWVRDVTYDEDRSRVRSGHLPQVLAALRNTAIGLFRHSGATNIASACRACAAQPWKALNLIGIQRTQ
ncbi:MAG TPA: ISAs1 family transposase [Abditibacteriaceae bacterium]|nr:ISAs1 family transposase [Abditibacteriaceae bacterium]